MWLYGVFMVVLWRFYVFFSGGLMVVNGDFVMDVWCFLGGFMVVLWWFYGGCMVVVWRFSGCFMMI